MIRGTWKTTTSIVSWIKESDFKEMNSKIWLNNIKVSKPPKLIISSWCHSHIRELHRASPDEEWLAICKVEPLWEGVFKMVDMIHPEQKTMSWEVEATDKWMDWATDFLIEKWEDLWKWNLVLHSHHSMGCFWSQTDNNARLWLNDGRTLAWAVVTAYKGNPDNWYIDYKGCVNFYKPYNIEIDCEIEHEEDISLISQEYENMEEKRKDKVDTLKKELFDKAIEENTDKINELRDKPNYDSIISYLWIDILEELNENYNDKVSLKLPNPQVVELMKELETKCEELAEEETPQEEEQEMPQEIAEWKAWSDLLCDQLEKAKVKSTYKGGTLSYPTSYYNYDYNFYDDYGNNDSKERIKSYTKSLFDNWEDTKGEQQEDIQLDYWYTKENYPTEADLRNNFSWIDQTSIKFTLSADDVWLVWLPWTKCWDYVDDCVEDLYDYFY